MKYLDKLSMWWDAGRMLVEIEESVRGFPRYQKYSVGAQRSSESFQGAGA